LWKNESKQETVQEISEREVLRELDSLSTQASKMYPVFDDTSAEFDPAVTQKVLTYMRGYTADNLSPPDAFVSALADVITLYNLDESEAQKTTKGGETKPASKKAIKKTKEKIAVAEKQPKSPAGQGAASIDAGATVPSIDKLSDAELDALPPETIARLRGDFVG
jgi:hypothetical protein